MTMNDVCDRAHGLKIRAMREGKSDDYILGISAVVNLLVDIQNECEELDKRQDIASLEDAMYKYGYDEVNVLDLLKFIVEYKHQ